ncbi:MAG: MBL fold metallo-hydrolase [Gemmatimonadetes bacterium]|nr:MBL fold metallo-hydrolase [Gemmatimonadota bacterium]
MESYICTTCGTQYPESDSPPARCPICEDERQYVGYGGQEWTTLERLRGKHRLALRRIEPTLYGIGMEPSFAIGQRALLVRTPEGNVLWDCVALLDDATVEVIEALGGIAAIAISHPHYYTTHAEWSRAFGGAPVYVHADDREWVVRPHDAVRFWEGETTPLPGGTTLVHCGGHFAGGQVLHWPAGAEGRGALLTGDVIQVVRDRRWVSFMYSYPNLIPLSASRVRRIVDAVAPYEYDRIYGAWWDLHVEHDAKAAVARSAERYLRAIGEVG